MRAVLFDPATGDGEVHPRVADVETPEPGPGEVRIRVAAYGLNQADLMRMSGRRYVGSEVRTRLGHEGLGYEASGVVDAVGAGVRGVSPGDRVSTVPNTDGPYSCAAEHALALEPFVTPWPAGWSAAEAAGFWMGHLSAYYPVVEMFPVSAGSAVMVTAASGGAGLGAIRVAKARGARVLATTRHRAKRAWLADRGADHVIVTDEEDLAAAMLEATGGRGVDLVCDGIGGDFAARYLPGLSRGGHAYVYGALSGSAEVSFPVLTLIERHVGVHGYSLGNVTRDHDALRRGVEHLQDGIASGRLPRPAVDSVHALTDVQRAYERLRSGEQRGKVVVSIDDSLR